MDDTVCRGDEPTLNECIAAQESDCSPSTDYIVGVRCNDNLGPGEQGPEPVTTTAAVPDVIIGACVKRVRLGKWHLLFSGKLWITMT